MLSKPNICLFRLRYVVLRQARQPAARGSGKLARPFGAAVEIIKEIVYRNYVEIYA